MPKIIVVFRTDLHKIKIKHRIIGEYATKRFFIFKKADHHYWKLINYALTWARPNLFYVSSPGAAACRVCLHCKYGSFMLFIDNNLLLSSARLHILNNIYRKWSYRHHHKFIKYEKRLRKEGKNMFGLLIKQNICKFSASLDA